MALSSSWVEKIHARLLVRYGAAWIRMWEGIDPGAVQADWAEELAGFEAHPNAIKYALENLPPDRPPTVAQFRAICINRPEAMPKQLQAPKADEAVVKAAVAAIKRGAGGNPLRWAYELRRRDRLGERLTLQQRKAWREVIGEESTTEAA